MSGLSIEKLDGMPADAVEDALRSCCGAETWCRRVAAKRPFVDLPNLHRIADQVFDSLDREDWLQAFSCHPKIGDLESLRMKFTGNREWSSGEQSGISDADEQTIRQLAKGNADYEAKFGYIFIVCASGKSAAEMLTLLRSRLSNAEEDELRIASIEQCKITHLRIDKLLA